MSTYFCIDFRMIGKRLKEERERLGFSQEEFAVHAGVTRSPYTSWEAGKTSPTAVQLAAIAAAGADVLYILTGERSSGTSTLKPDEEALVDNFRHCSPEAQRIIRAASSAGAQPEVKGKSA
jgi:transcriptional regulator with XRE-family HTH domain